VHKWIVATADEDLQRKHFLGNMITFYIPGHLAIFEIKHRLKMKRTRQMTKK